MTFSDHEGQSRSQVMGSFDRSNMISIIG